ncbi:hypothetical protein WICPIJ_008630 [Wickerhamomyces pijperi]|uniref:Uncharacterized protein n=1 Tax=Wickerhamomyces pijperi TaxID=599730 RepID=A0A9P8PXI8_WICPI|nr:hypothetical protein WICPIJ_008630 [Wickerhamomyces pijperi]
MIQIQIQIHLPDSNLSTCLFNSNTKPKFFTNSSYLDITIAVGIVGLTPTPNSARDVLIFAWIEVLNCGILLERK